MIDRGRSNSSQHSIDGLVIDDDGITPVAGSQRDKRDKETSGESE